MISMLSDLSLTQKKKYGTKASSLGELIRNSINVPIGFALSSEFFDEFLKINNFEYSAQNYLICNEEIKRFILKAEFSEDMEVMLHRFFENIATDINQQQFAVRSSALCEDNENYSMAGMFSSFIELSSFEKIKMSIKKCYASLFSDKVMEYFADNNLNFKELKMAVIIQKFISGEYSGVNFSVDSIDMDKNMMHMNIVEGTCNNYVDGRAESIFYKVNKETGALVEKNLPEGMREPNIDVINRLYEKTIQVERIFNTYQDIEWTIKNGDIFILQARPITTFRNKEFKVNWENDNDSNYTWYKDGDKPYEPLVNELSLLEGEALNSGLHHAGTPNLYSYYCVQNGYFFFADREMQDSKQKKDKLLEKIKDLHKDYKNIFQDEILPKLLLYKNELDNYIRKRLTREETSEFLKKAVAYMQFLSCNHETVTHACDYMDAFIEYCKSIDEGIKIDDIYDLVFRISILNREREFYISMAEEIASNQVLLDMFMDCKYNKLLYSRIINEPKGEKLVEIIKDYIKNFGMCNMEEDINNPYSQIILEAPEKVIGHVRRFLNFSAKNFKVSIENSLKNKEKVKNHLLSKLDENSKEEFLNRLSLAEKAYISRDNHHFYFERMIRSYIRPALHKAEEELLANASLSCSGDIYFLNLKEIEEGLKKAIDFSDIVRKRKSIFDWQKKLLVPDIIGKRPEEDMLENNEKEDTYSDLKGISGLRKKVRGKVKVGIPKQLEQDAILVLPFTRCGELEAIFNHVVGIIVENGSPFEHLGIIAREMNIPVIYNVKNATSLLKEGDEVILDGINGIVTLIK
ncbi:hypothetical protein IAI10_07810 [Clostridium sp. 19966]|uniref:PEP/pyruvate-binding domain-containing protein n=1 Tax=Clostridium sp. 19966 TaxID=2768166 RepID=UPI0028DE919B|nr:PEP/pyruvate-binding domain-containing protein [Clostridium sp. 19966]MDT8716558.1 hypothetical protein [Clostridium sp. 19966]